MSTGDKFNCAGAKLNKLGQTTMDTAPDDIVVLILERAKDPRGLALTCRHTTAVYYHRLRLLRLIYAGSYEKSIIAVAPPRTYRMFTTRELYVSGNLPALQYAWAHSCMTRPRFLKTMFSGLINRIGDLVEFSSIMTVRDKNGAMARWLYRVFGGHLVKFIHAFMRCSHDHVIRMFIEHRREEIIAAALQLQASIMYLKFSTFKLCADLLQNEHFIQLDAQTFTNKKLAYLAIRGIPLVPRLASDISFGKLCMLRIDDIITFHYLLNPTDPAAVDRFNYILRTRRG